MQKAQRTTISFGQGFRREDVIIDVLLLLSVKPLVRFRCISKSWCSVIKSHAFINNHFLKRQKDGSVMLVKRCLNMSENSDLFSFYDSNSPEPEELWPNLPIPYFKDVKFDYDEFYLPQRVTLMGPIKGLVCLAYGDCVYLCNPSLREFRQLPSTPFASPDGYCVDIIGYGFGETCTNCFKVVLIESITPDDKDVHVKHHMNMYIYNSETNSWRHMADDSTMVKYICHFPCNDFFFNGACHWNANSSDVFYADVILTLDITSEVIGKMEYPDCLAELAKSFLSFMALNECLAMVRYQEWMSEPKLVDIWVMKQYGVRESWTKMYVIGPQVVVISHVCWKNDECLIVENGDGQLVSCAFRTNELKKLPIHAVHETLRALMYSESLVSLNHVVNL